MTKILTPLILIILAGGIFFYLTDPLWAEVQVLKAQEAKLNEALDNAQKLRKELDNLLGVYNQIRAEDLEKLDKFLPDTVDNVRLIIDINGVAARYGMTLKNISIKSSESNKNPNQPNATPAPTAADSALAGAGSAETGSIILGFSVSGPYRAFQGFLNDLSHSLRLVDINSLSFSGDDKDFYQYNVELKTYWLK